MSDELDGTAENDLMDDPFVRFPRDTARDATLSWKARGILAWMLSHATNWTIRQEDMIAAATDGLASLRAGLDELIIAGYIERRKVQRPNGGWRYKYVIRDRRNDAMCGKSTPAKTMCGKSAPACVENPHSKKTKEVEEKESSSSRARKDENPEAINTESKEIEPPKSPVVQDKGSNSMARRPDFDPPAPQPPGTPDTKRKRLAQEKRWTYDGFAAALDEDLDKIDALPHRSLWVIDHWTEAEIREAIRITAGANSPCWKYLCTVLTGMDETPAQKSRRKGGGGIKAPPELRFDDDLLQWVEVKP